MKNIYDVLKQKEAEAVRLQKEVEALQLAARLLAEEADVPPPAASAKVVAAK